MKRLVQIREGFDASALAQFIISQAVFDELGNTPHMVEMRMGHEERINTRRLKGEGPVDALFANVSALFETAVYKYLPFLSFNQKV